MRYDDFKRQLTKRNIFFENGDQGKGVICSIKIPLKSDCCEKLDVIVQFCFDYTIKYIIVVPIETEINGEEGE